MCEETPTCLLVVFDCAESDEGAAASPTLIDSNDLHGTTISPSSGVCACGAVESSLLIDCDWVTEEMLWCRQCGGRFVVCPTCPGEKQMQSHAEACRSGNGENARWNLLGSARRVNIADFIETASGIEDYGTTSYVARRRIMRIIAMREWLHGAATIPPNEHEWVPVDCWDVRKAGFPDLAAKKTLCLRCRCDWCGTTNHDVEFFDVLST